MKQIVIAFLTLFAIAACSDRKGFRVDVDAPAIGTQQITVVYTLPDGNRSVVSVPSINGHFSFKGYSVEPSTVELFTANKRFLVAIIAQDGDRIDLQCADSVWTAQGNELAQYLLDYQIGDTIEILPEPVQAAIKSIYQPTEPTDTTKQLIFKSPELILNKDSVNTFEPEGVWFFTSDAEERTVAVLDSMRRYSDDNRDVRDVYLSADISAWRRMIRRDTATWTQALLPDAPVVLSGVLRTTPCLVEVDTAGVVVRIQRL